MPSSATKATPAGIRARASMSTPGADELAAQLLRDVQEIAPNEVREATAAMTPTEVHRFAEQVSAAALHLVRSVRGATEHSTAIEHLDTSVTPETARGLQTTENSFRQVGDEFGWLTSTEVAGLVGS